MSEELHSAQFWSHHMKLNDQPLFTEEQRIQWHALWSHNVPSITDLASFPKQISHDQIRLWLDADDDGFREPFYDEHNQLLTNIFWTAVRDNCNKPTDERSITCTYAFAITRVDVRTLATSTGVFKEGQAPRFDRMQETAVHTFEPLIVLHRSRDKTFVYVQAQYYRGWVRNDQLAVVDYESFLRQLGSNHFLVVTGRTVTVTTTTADEHIQVEFAARLPLDQNYASPFVVTLPGRDENGMFYARSGSIASHADVHVGFLPCTRQSIVTQAFKLLGEPYGWGDEQGLHDCSSFVMDVYRVFGLNLPRNAGDQEQLPGVSRIVLSSDMTDLDRRRAFLDCQSGDLIYMPGHTMIYLGEWEKRLYVIHDFSGYAERLDDGSFTYVPVLQVGVSPLEFYLLSGTTYLDALTTVLTFQSKSMSS